MINVYTISIIFSISFLILVIELVKKNRLQERYSLLWIIMGILLLVLSSTPIIINTIAKWLDIKNPPSLLFLFGMVYLLVYSLHITTVISKQADKITRLAQELALLKQKIEQAGDNEKPSD
jgi:hypothetical protein